MADVDAALVPIYAAVGGLVVKEVFQGGAAFVKWLGARKTQLEDEKLAELRKDVEELQGQREALVAGLTKLDGAISAIANEQRYLKEKLDASLGSLASTRESLDDRIEKQAAFYRDSVKEVLSSVTAKIKELEYELRQDTTRAIHDSQALLKQNLRKR
jgi:chromosome segregation ATPase